MDDVEKIGRKILFVFHWNIWILYVTRWVKRNIDTHQSKNVEILTRQSLRLKWTIWQLFFDFILRLYLILSNILDGFDSFPVLYGLVVNFAIVWQF